MVSREKKVLLIGLLDQAGGHYKAYAHRFLKVLTQIKGISILGYITSEEFAWKDFENTIEPSKFYNVLPERKSKALRINSKLMSRLMYNWDLAVRARRAREVMRREGLKPDVLIFLDVDVPFLSICTFISKLVMPYSFIVVLHNAVSWIEHASKRVERRVKMLLLRRVVNKSVCSIVIDPFIKERLCQAVQGVNRSKILVVNDPRFEWTGLGRTRCIKKRIATKCFLIIGAITPQKGVDLAIKAFAEATQGFNDVCLTVAGRVDSPAYERKLRQLITSLGDKRIQLINRHLTHEEYQEYLEAADYVIFPYRKEYGTRSSGPVLDALAYFKPVIIPNFGIFRAIHDRYGLGRLFKPECVADLAARIREALRETDLDYSLMTRGYREFIMDYSVENAVLQLRDILSQLI